MQSTPPATVKSKNVIDDDSSSDSDDDIPVTALMTTGKQQPVDVTMTDASDSTHTVSITNSITLGAGNNSSQAPITLQQHLHIQSPYRQAAASTTITTTTTSACKPETSGRSVSDSVQSGVPLSKLSIGVDSPMSRSSAVRMEVDSQMPSSRVSPIPVTTLPAKREQSANDNEEDSSESESESESSDSDDDIPLVSIVAARSLSTSVTTTPRSQPLSDSSSAEKTPLRPKSASSTLSKKPKARGQKRSYAFMDSDDSESEEDSSEDVPLIAAAKREMPRYEPPPKPKIPPKPKTKPKAKSKSKPKPKAKTRSKTTATRKRAKLNSGRASTSSRSPRRTKRAGFVTKGVMNAADYVTKDAIVPLHSDKNAVKWWDRLEELDDKKKWNSLDHNGILFTPVYKAHGVKMLYDGEPMDLCPEQEEVATMFAHCIETDWVHKERFRHNFMKEFKKLLCDRRQERRFPQVTDLSKCDFRAIKQWVDERKATDKEMKKDKTYKDLLKSQKAELDELYGFAVVDGVRERVANFNVEPPGLFRGRGEHPKMGLLKKRLTPEDVVINIGKDTPIPKCPVEGHQWGGVVHDQTVTYIAKWVENINDAHKFVYLHASSRFKGEADVKKYNKARELSKHIEKIRRDYESKLRATNRFEQQLATAVWVIDRLAIRVGNEKDTDEEADTVGVCSLRLEHIKFSPPVTVAEEKASQSAVAEAKRKEDDDFMAAISSPKKKKKKKSKKRKSASASSSSLASSTASSDEETEEKSSEALSSPLNGGTNNAGHSMQFEAFGGKKGLVYKITLDFLGKDSMRYLQTVIVPGVIYENLEKFCRGKKQDHSILEKIDSSEVNTYLKKHMEGLSAKVFRTYNASVTLEEELAKGMHPSVGQITAESPLNDKVFFYNQCNKEVAILCNHQRSVSKSHGAQLEKATQNIEALETSIKELQTELKLVRSGRWQPTSDPKTGRKRKARSAEMLQRMIQRKTVSLRKKRLDIVAKRENKEIALGTSKINYMDPRVTAAWCKRLEVPIEKVFNKSLLEKFPWAMAADPKYKF